MKFAIGAIVKNEASSILEWVAYHRVIGIDHFFIADNGSQDGTLQILKGLEQQGLLTVFRFPTLGSQAPQLLAYKKILKLAKKDYCAVAFIDADEYLVPMDGSDSIRVYLTKWFINPENSAVALNWACFGSGGQLFKKPGLVIERFTLRFSQKRNHNRHYKTIVRPDRVESFYNPHMVKLISGNYINVLENELIPHPKQQFGLSSESIWQPVRINHYVTKSLEEFLVRKSPAGSAATFGKEKHERYFNSHDHNDESCHVAANLAPKVKDEIQKLDVLNNQYIQSSVKVQYWDHLKSKVSHYRALLRIWWLS